jgi:hypothetical protein
LKYCSLKDASHLIPIREEERKEVSMSTTLLEQPIPPVVVAVKTVKSSWAKTPPLISGNFSTNEWVDAGIMPIPAGYLMVKNDHKFLYLALDLTGDQGKSPGVGDYFWLTFDVDGNAKITPNKDVNYGIYQNLPIRMGRQFCLGPAVWTTLLNDPSESMTRQGFAASGHSATAHRIWEMRIALSELGIDFNNLTTPPKLRFGLRVSSTTPNFTYDFPTSFYTNFADLREILLLVGPTIQPTNGLAMAAVGIIPQTLIDATGRATTADGYFIDIKNGAFGGAIHIKGDKQTLANLYSQGARKYRVLCGPKGSPKSPLRQTWLNYKKVSFNWELETFAPDADGNYPLPLPGDEYSIEHLLVQWNTNGFAGLCELETRFFTDNNVEVPSTAQTLPVFVDNNLPDVRILGIRYGQHEVAPCEIVNVQETTDLMQIHIRAFDAEGDLYRYALNAYYGDNQVFSPPLAEQTYNPANSVWQGVSDRWVLAGDPASQVPPKFPPTTCAYEFRLSAWPRVTNGYDYIGYTEATMHVTLQRPGAPHITALRFSKQLPMGFTPDSTFKKGVTPDKLG